eukprot:g431.t1
MFCSRHLRHLLLLLLPFHASSRWSQFHGDASKTGRSPVSGPARGTVAWKARVGCLHWGPGCWLPGFQGTDSSPAISPDGATVVIGSYDRSIYGVDAANGTVKWKTETGPGIGIESSPAVSDGNIAVVGSYDKKVWAVNVSAAGRPVWEFATGDYVASAPAIDGGGGVAFIGGVDGRVYAIDVLTGRQKWTFNASGQAVWAPVAVVRGLVYFGAGGNAIPTVEEHARVHCVDAATGAGIWSYETGSQIQSCPTVGPAGDTLYIGCYDGCLYALSAGNGTFRWKACVGSGRIESSPAAFFLDTTESGGGGGGDDDDDAATEVVVVGSIDGNVTAFLGSNGSVLWTRRIGKEVGSSPAIDKDGTVYIGADGVWALRGATGEVVWHNTEMTALVGSSPALAEDGSLFVGSEDGYLYKIN